MNDEGKDEEDGGAECVREEHIEGRLHGIDSMETSRMTRETPPWDGEMHRSAKRRYQAGTQRSDCGAVVVGRGGDVSFGPVGAVDVIGWKL